MEGQWCGVTLARLLSKEILDRNENTVGRATFEAPLACRIAVVDSLTFASPHQRNPGRLLPLQDLLIYPL